MKLSKGMSYYFVFWITYLPFAILLTLFQDYGFVKFLVVIGSGALILLVFLTLRLIIFKLRKRGAIYPIENTSSSETPVPKDNLEGFRTIFTEVKNENLQVS